MRVLFVMKNFGVGGAQMSVARLASTLAESGHDIAVLAATGPLDTMLTDRSVQRYRPAAERVRVSDIVRAAHAHRPDALVAVDPAHICTAAAATRRIDRAVRLLGVQYGTRVPWYLPESVAVTVPTLRLWKFSRQWRTAPTYFLPPTGHEQLCTPTEARPERSVLVVSRLASSFKSQALIEVIDSMSTLAERGYTMRLVGGGPLRDQLVERAQRLTTADGFNPIEFVGETVGIERELQRATVVVASGMAAIEAALHRVPCVVVGRNGFVLPVRPRHLYELVYAGFYGAGVSGWRLADAVTDAVSTSPTELDEIAEALSAIYRPKAVADRLLDLLERVEPLRPGRGELVRARVRRVTYRYRRWWQRRLGALRGLDGDEREDFAFGRLRNMALPPARRWTGRTRSAPVEDFAVSPLPVELTTDPDPMPQRFF